MRQWLDRAGYLICASCAAVAVGLFLLIVGTVLWRGGSAISWSFVSDQMRLVGASGGIFYNIIGTLILISTALLVSAPLAFALALTLAVYLRDRRWNARLTLLLYILNAVPSILYGLLGFIVFVSFFRWGKSWCTGGILLGLVMLPTVAVSLTERIRAVPTRYLEAASGLGLTQAQIVWSVILPQSLNGWVTGSLLGLARVAGETAPIMFTATIFAGATWPTGIRENPVLSLPYHIFVLAQDSFDPAVGAKLWGAALILLGLVFALSLIALPLRLRLHEEAGPP